MKRFGIEVSAAAEADVPQAFLWYFERSPIAADAFRSEVFNAIESLADQAAMWPRSEDGLHFRVLHRFPYTVHYELIEDTATVIAVAHQRRRPRSWQPR